MSVIPGTIPAGTCPTSEQNRLNLYASLLSVTFPVNATAFNYGNTVPIPDNQSFPWLRLNSDGTPDGLYVYSNGNWIRPHPIPSGSPILFAYNGSLASIQTYDGGESGAVTIDTGPMWQVATTDGLAPAGDGSNVVGYGQFLIGVSSNYAQGSTGGEATHVLTQAELPNVNLSIPGFSNIAGIPGPEAASLASGGSVGFRGNSIPLGGLSQGHNNIPPYLAIYYIQRTSRLYYRAS